MDGNRKSGRPQNIKFKEKKREENQEPDSRKLPQTFILTIVRLRKICGKKINNFVTTRV